MKMKKWIALLLVLCTLFLATACTAPENEDRETETTWQTETTVPETTVPETTVPETTVTETETSAVSPLLYKVTDGQGNVVWLFGSIHVGEEYFYPLPEYVISAYESADALAVEFDIVAFEKDIAAATKVARMMIYSDGTTIRDHIPEELYTDAVAILEENDLYAAYMDYLYPTMLADMIDSILYDEIGADHDLGIDKHLLDRAHAENKPILDIESAEFQIGMMVGYSEPLQSLLLEGSVASYGEPDEMKEALNEMLTLWASGDEAAFYAYLSEEEVFETEEEEQLYEEYNKAMLTDRNIAMADFAADALADGEEVFICVGAAHVVGKGAMVELLRERGYTVELVKE